MSPTPLRASLEGHATSHRLHGAALFLGRDADGSWQLDRWVSKPEATFIPKGSGATVMALGKDLFVNRRRLAVGRAVTLRPGDRLQVGKAVVWIHPADVAPGRVSTRRATARAALALAVLATCVGVLWPSAAVPDPARDRETQPLPPQAAPAQQARPARPDPAARRVQRQALAEAESLARLGAPDAAARVVDRALARLEHPALRAQLLDLRESLASQEPAVADTHQSATPAPLEAAAETEASESEQPSQPPEEELEAKSQEGLAGGEPPATDADPVEPRAVEPELLLSPPRAFEAAAEPEGGADPVLQAEVDEAIVHGVEALRNAAGSARRPGESALYAFALLRSGVDLDDEVVAERLAALREAEITQTYDLALAIMAWEATSVVRAAPGSGTRYGRRDLAGGPRKQIEALARGLLAGQRQAGDWGYYCESGSSTRRRALGSSDNSNTQFAVLGLHAAERSGVEVPQACWRKVYEHFRDSATRSPIRAWAAVEWSSARPALLGGGGETRALPKQERNGWGYRPHNSEGFNMTCAGLSSIVIAGNALYEAGVLEPEGRAIVEQLTRGACSTLAPQLDQLNARGRWSVYGLYSLEKAMDVSGVQRLEGTDWWEAAARALLRTQGEDGGWGTTSDTALALLVLNRATLSLGPQTRVRGGARATINPFTVKVGSRTVDVRRLLRQVHYGNAPRDDLRRLRKAYRKISPGLRPQLVAGLAALLESDEGWIRRFAKASLKDVTGERLEPAAYVAWGERYLALSRVGPAPGSEQVQLVLASLGQAPDGPLLRVAATAALRGSLCKAVPALLSALGRVKTAETRDHLLSTLRLLTGVDPAEAQEGDRAARVWAAWGDRHAEDLERWMLVGELVAGGARAAAARPAVLALGEAVIPELLRAYAANPDLVRLHETLRELTGLEPEANPEAWRAVWGGSALSADPTH